MSDIKKFNGKDVDVTWDKRLCIHVGECGRSEDELFVGGRDPWCVPDESSADEVVEVMKRCPSGALVAIRKDGGAAETAPAVNQVAIANNGPLYFTGELELDGASEDMPGTKFRAALCRCGESKNKPFCDNTHESIGFVDRGAVGVKSTESIEGGGALKVSRAKDGPLLLSGNFQIITPNGRVAWTGSKAALCRCGKSDNKPFCDGTHKPAGFEAE